MIVESRVNGTKPKYHNGAGYCDIGFTGDDEAVIIPSIKGKTQKSSGQLFQLLLRHVLNEQRTGIYLMTLLDHPIQIWKLSHPLNCTNHFTGM